MNVEIGTPSNSYSIENSVFAKFHHVIIENLSKPMKMQHLGRMFRYWIGLSIQLNFFLKIDFVGQFISSQKSVYLEVLCCQPDVGDELGAVAEDGVQHLAPLVRRVLHIVLLLLLTLNQIHQLQYLYT
jgi:hypothetical protein